MTKGPRAVEVLERKALYQDYYRADKYCLRHEQFGGGMGRPIWREVMERGHAATVLPYDPVRDEVLLIEQFRIGAFTAGHHPWTIEVVAGIVEEGEEPEQVVRREAMEEAGCTIQELEAINSTFPSVWSANTTGSSLAASTVRAPAVFTASITRTRTSRCWSCRAPRPRRWCARTASPPARP